jgi:hypothetical protein
MARRTMPMPVVSSAVDSFQLLQHLLGADVGHTAARHDAFLHGSAGGMQGIVHAVLLLLHLHLGGGADVEHGHTAGQLGQALLQLLLVVVAGGGLDLGLDLVHTPGDVGLLAGAVHDRGVVLVDADLLGLAQVAQVGVLQLEAALLADHGAAGEDGDVLQHGLAAVAEAGGLHGATFRAPRILFTTRVASASPSTSSLMISRGLPVCAPSPGSAAAPSCC